MNSAINRKERGNGAGIQFGYHAVLTSGADSGKFGMQNELQKMPSGSKMTLLKKQWPPSKLEWKKSAMEF